MAEVAQAWQKLMTAVTQTLAFGDDPNRVRFQISMNPQEYVFVGSNGLWNFYDFAELIPVWQAGFVDTDKRLLVEYEAFLDDIKPGGAIDTDAAAQLEALKPEVQKALKDYNDYKNGLAKAWHDFNQEQQGLPPELQLGPDDWYNQNFVPGLTDLQNTYEDLHGQQVILERRAYGGGQEFADALDNLNKKGFPYEDDVPVDLVGSDGKTVTKIVARKAWSMQPLPSQILQDIQQGNVNQVSFTVTSNTGNYDVSSWEVGGSAGLDLGFISIGGSGGDKHVSVDSSDVRFKLTFSAVSINSIVMTPRDWFDQGILIRYKDAAGAAAFFGPSPGLLNLLKRRVWLVYQPTITLELDQNSYREVTSQWQAGAPLSIGPFSFGGGASGSSDEIHFDDAGATITTKSKSPLLQVFALSSLVMPG